MSHKHTNHLINETSPYLLQHAHNPVEWYPWGDEALQKAQAEHKIILVSIGYAACHWCHVMERESFEDEDTADIMNRHFINIKIDREERPDLDHIYMDAVQAIAGNGGWPLNVFLTPETKPFYGGTYFPPVRAFNRPSWKEVLQGVAQAWRERRSEIEVQANDLTAHIAGADSFINKLPDLQGEGSVFTAELCRNMFAAILKNADTEWGGFGAAPKFPQTFTVGYLLQYYYASGNADALDQALLSLDKMLQGGIYDQVGGGFARYSTDNEWLAPHFEKMLYDNALLLMVLCDAYAITQNEQYEKAIHHTIAFVKREMRHAEGGFFAALDADSEGVEGKFYTWQKAELTAILGDDAALFAEFYDVTEVGNWEHVNILRILEPAPQFCQRKQLELIAFEATMQSCLHKLLVYREQRIRPQTDDKVLLGWNAMMITALCKAAGVLCYPSYGELAMETFSFLWNNCRVPESGVKMYHTFKEGKAKYPAFLDDYACLIQACLHLQELSSNSDYLQKAQALTEHVLTEFGDAETGYFFFTHAGQTDVVVRKKEVYDGATASGNSLMAQHLLYLGIVLDKADWRERAQQMLGGLLPAVTQYPTSFGGWASLALNLALGMEEVVVTGLDYEVQRNALLATYHPNRVMQCAVGGNSDFPLLVGKVMEGETAVFLCKNYSCLQPFVTAGELVQHLSTTARF